MRRQSFWGIAAFLIHRGLRQASNAAALKIEMTSGIYEDRFVRIGGIDQWIGIRGEDRNNPVLLVVHGGPGSSYVIFTPLARSWEKHFTVVQWDQRGAGKTFRRTGSRASGELTMEQLTRDGIEVAEHLCGPTQQEPDILAGKFVRVHIWSGDCAAASRHFLCIRRRRSEYWYGAWEG